MKKEIGTVQDLNPQEGDIFKLLSSTYGSFTLGFHYECRRGKTGFGSEAVGPVNPTSGLVVTSPSKIIWEVVSRATPAADLTTITTPFGLLDEATQEALRTHGGPYEMYSSKGWAPIVNPIWNKVAVYRVKRMPVVVKQKYHQTVWGVPLTITATTVDGVLDESSFKIEVNK